MKNKHQAGRFGNTNGRAKQIPIAFPTAAAQDAAGKIGVMKHGNLGGAVGIPKGGAKQVPILHLTPVYEKIALGYSSGLREVFLRPLPKSAGAVARCMAAHVKIVEGFESARLADN